MAKTKLGVYDRASCQDHWDDLIDGNFLLNSVTWLLKFSSSSIVTPTIFVPCCSSLLNV